MSKKQNAEGEELDQARWEEESPAAAAPNAPLLEERLAALQEECRQLDDRWKRALAEAENARRRFAREREEFELLAARRYLLPFLEVADGLEHALRTAAVEEAVATPQSAPERFSAFVRGVELIRDKLKEALAREGVAPIECVGRPFDPELHEAVMQVDNQQLDSQTVVEEFQRGYMMKDRLLRPAKVSVAK